MKSKLLLSMALLLIGVTLFGQQFVSEQNQWNVMLTVFPGGTSTEIFKIEGDSVFKSISYKKIWISYDSLSTWIFTGLLREDADVVWFVNKTDTTENILYNFNLVTGDTITIVNGFCSEGESVSVSVQEVDTVEFFGTRYKRLHLFDNNMMEDYWLEGVGSLSGPLYSMFGSIIVCPAWELLCSYRGESIVYENENEGSCWVVGIDENKQIDAVLKPNPVVKGQPFTIETVQNITNVSIYNASGSLIKTVSKLAPHVAEIQTSELKSGMYLIKIIVKGNKTATYKLVVKE